MRKIIPGLVLVVAGALLATPAPATAAAGGIVAPDKSGDAKRVSGGERVTARISGDLTRAFAQVKYLGGGQQLLDFGVTASAPFQDSPCQYDIKLNFTTLTPASGARTNYAIKMGNGRFTPGSNQFDPSHPELVVYRNGKVIHPGLELVSGPNEEVQWTRTQAFRGAGKTAYGYLNADILGKSRIVRVAASAKVYCSVPDSGPDRRDYTKDLVPAKSA